MNRPAASWAASSERTSSRSAGSSAPHSARNASRPSAGRSAAWEKSAFTLAQRSSATVVSFREAAVEPRLGQLPLALHGRRGHVQRGGGLLDGEPAEVPKFDHLGSEGV